MRDETPAARLRRVAMRVEDRIRELRDAGELSGLPGEGEPLPGDPDEDAGDRWATRHLLRTSGARPLWAELRRDITERRSRIIVRLRAHLEWLDRRRALLEHLPAERIVPEVARTNEIDARVRADLAQAIAELNLLVRDHNLAVTATPLHITIVTLEDLMQVAREGR